MKGHRRSRRRWDPRLCVFTIFLGRRRVRASSRMAGGGCEGPGGPPGGVLWSVVLCEDPFGLRSNKRDGPRG